MLALPAHTHTRTHTLTHTQCTLSYARPALAAVLGRATVPPSPPACLCVSAGVPSDSPALPLRCCAAPLAQDEREKLAALHQRLIDQLAAADTRRLTELALLRGEMEALDRSWTSRFEAQTTDLEQCRSTLEATSATLETTKVGACGARHEAHGTRRMSWAHTHTGT